MPQSLRSLIADYVSLTDSEWDLLISKFRRVTLKKNNFLIKEGQICNCVYFIDKGLMRMYYQKDGLETTRYFAIEGEFATALSSFISRTPTIENIQSIEPCDLLQVNYDDFNFLCNEIPAWKNLYLKMIQLAYVNSTKRIEALITQSAEERYRQFVKDEQEIVQRVPQQYIATYLGITPVSLSRIRSQISNS